MHKAIWRRLAPAAIITVAAAGVVVVSGSPAGAVRPLARATIHNAAGAAIGTIELSGSGSNAERVAIELALPTDAPGLGGYHGLHIHTVGACSPTFTDAGGHWSVAAADHGDHTGDLPSILVGTDGRASAEFETHRFDVSELFDANGSAIVLHAGRDNFGNVPIGGAAYQDPNGFYASSTSKTGDAGGRYGCGVLEAA